MLLVGLARQDAQPLGIHRQRAGEGERLLAGLERLQIGDEHFVGHDRGGAEHLGAADGDAARVFIDDPRHQILILLAPAFAPFGLRIDDHVGEKKIVLRGEIEIVGERLGALGAVLAEHLDAHALADQRGGQVVRRTPEIAAGLGRPGLQRLAPLHHLLVAARHLPGAIDPAVGAVRAKRHELEIFRLGLVIIERSCRMHGVAKGRVLGDIADKLAVKIDGASVLERLDVLGAGLAIAHVQTPSAGACAFRHSQVSPSIPLISSALSPPTR